MEIFFAGIKFNYTWVYPEAHSFVKYTKNFIALLWMGFNCLKAAGPLRLDSLLFYHSNGNGLLNIYRKIPLICSMYISPRIYAHPQIGPSNLSSLRNIKFTKNVTFMYFASAIYLPSFSVSGNFA